MPSSRSPRWEDLRFVLAVAQQGSLLRAGARLGVDHTTVGRRVVAAERALGVTLFTRSTSGLSLTAEGSALIAPLEQAEQALLAVARRAGGSDGALAGRVKVTAPETFGLAWLAPRLSRFASQHPGLRIDLVASGAVLDLNRREAEVAVRMMRSRDQRLAVRRGATLRHGLYAARSLLARSPVRTAADLRGKPILVGADTDPDTRWLSALAQTEPVFSCVVAMGLLGAARDGAGFAVLPRYLGDNEPSLARVAFADPPSDTLWLTVHRDLRTSPRVRAVLDYLFQTMRDELGP